MNAAASFQGLLSGYDAGQYFCEMFGRRGLAHTRAIRERLDSLDIATLRRRSRDAEGELFNLGITFTVYTDREFPIEPFAQSISFSYPMREIPDLGRTIERHCPDPDRRITEWTRQFLSQDSGTTDTEAFLLAVTKAIREAFEYQIRYEPGVQTPVATLEKGAGTISFP